MKLQPALIFGEHMVLQRDQPIPVWGRSARDDTVTVTLNGIQRQAAAVSGKWLVTFPKLDSTEHTTMTIESAVTGEHITFNDVAVGEVWLAGGQSNMEFLLKYDEGAAAMRATPADPDLRFFRYPQTCFLGNLERDTFPDDGFWRRWDSADNIDFFSGPSAYMGRELRRVLGVPVGFVGCNWGGTNAAAWTAMEDLKANPALKPILDWQKEVCAKLDLPKYEEDSLVPAKEPTEEQKNLLDALMMGGDPKEIFKKFPMKMPEGYSPFIPGPKAAVRPAGLYDHMLRRVAPYAVRGVIWYQGEDDDARGWQDFYDESMKTLIGSWRKLWDRELPFLQVELPPLGKGFGKATNYPVIREKQRAAMDAMPGVHNVCIMDAGDENNIHVRKKKPVGERLALLARKYVYGEDTLTADSPRLKSADRREDCVVLHFEHSGSGLCWKEGVCCAFEVSADGRAVAPSVTAQGNTLVLKHKDFASAKSVAVSYCEENYCEAALFNSAGLPAFPFTIQTEPGKGESGNES